MRESLVNLVDDLPENIPGMSRVILIDEVIIIHALECQELNSDDVRFELFTVGIFSWLVHEFQNRIYIYYS